MCLLCVSIITGMSFEQFSVSYLVPASACELHTTNTQQGLMACVPLIGIVLTSAIWGYLADTRGRRKIIIISMTMSFVTGTLSAFSPHWIVLSVLKLFSSASVAGAFALSVTILSECTPMAKRSYLVILATTMFLAAIGSMSVISIPLLPLKFSYYVPILGIHLNSWRLLCVVFAFPSAISALGAAFAYESPKYLLTVGKNEEALEVLRGIYVINTGKSRDTYKVDVLYLDEDNITTVDKGFFASLASQSGPLLKKPLLKYTALLSALFVLTYICINSFLVWLPFIVNVLMTPQDNSYCTFCEMIRIYQNSTVVEENSDCSLDSFAMIMVFGINMILAACNVVMSALFNVLGRKNIYIGIQIISGIAAVCVTSSPYWMLTSALFMIFLSSVFNFGLLNTFSVDIFPTYVRATAVCLTLMLGRGSAIFGINILKHMLYYDCDLIFYLFGGISCLGGIIGLLLPSDKEIFKKTSVAKA